MACPIVDRTPRVGMSFSVLSPVTWVTCSILSFPFCAMGGLREDYLAQLVKTLSRHRARQRVFALPIRKA